MIIRYSNVYEILRLLPEGSELKKSPIYAELGEQYKKDKDSVIGSKGVHQLLQLLSQPDLRKLSPQESSCVNALIDLISGIYWDLFHLSISKKVDDTDLLSVFRKILEYNIGSRDKDSHDELLMRVIADSSDPRAFPDTQFDFIGSYLTSFFPQSKDVFSSLKDYRSLYASCSYMTLRSFHETSDNLKRLLENCMDGSPFDFHICEFTVKVFYYMHTASLKAVDPFNIVMSARSIISKFRGLQFDMDHIKSIVECVSGLDNQISESEQEKAIQDVVSRIWKEQQSNLILFACQHAVNDDQSTFNQRFGSTLFKQQARENLFEIAHELSHLETESSNSRF